MLEFNPFFRYSTEECLKHPYFDEVRNKKLETSTCEKIPEFDPEARLTHVIHKYKLEQKNSIIKPIDALIDEFDSD